MEFFDKLKSFKYYFVHNNIEAVLDQIRKNVLNKSKT